ncbi:PREDICTED: uncharacterized protein LOC104707322 [Camelina sativa]|uniref:Uncharacterized protein LOC104707322 n=1 Tax=Camelina sativa TaxID=90675 RepID=A0ABM0T7A8_CAMSA|nr:PREDICTED: uncharacterized protein LOC104707322 [Camelina sativa]
MASTATSSSGATCSRATSSTPGEKVALFWDINTCPIKNYYANHLESINTVLKEINPNYRVSTTTKIICGDIKKCMNEATQDYFRELGFEICHAEERDPRCDLHEKRKPDNPEPAFALLVKVMEFLVERPHHAKNIFIISGDYRFKHTMKMLLESNWTTFLAKKKDSNTKSTKYATYTWNWEDIEG